MSVSPCLSINFHFNYTVKQQEQQEQKERKTFPLTMAVIGFKRHKNEAYFWVEL